jgi:hypothetical protein
MDLTRKGHHIRRQFAVAGGTHVFSPTLLNSFHIGANRVAASINQNMAIVNHFANDTSFAAIPGQGPARIFMNGFSLMPGGVGGAAHVFHGYTSYQAYDDVFLTRGTHSLKFGVSLENIRNDTTSFQGAGDWTFGSLSAFLTNKPLSFVGTLVGFATPRDVHQLLVGTYIQDDWRVRRNLTLNLGLRHEAATVPSEVHGKYVTLLPALPCFNLRGNARRNVLVGLGFANLDFSIYKNTAFLSDRFTTQFRVEFFNVLNHTNFQAPLSNNVLFDQTGAPVAGAGALTQTTHDSREIQVALKLLW